ncbi:hypothetical protein DFP73DRAFT_586834 [Morchella snyderi]|nr:hypothetical protein DFP73DRAFT_586834 [Morchella snyderi]
MGSLTISRLRFLNRSDPLAEIWHQLRSTNGERTSYYITGVPDGSLKFSQGDFEGGSHGNSNLIAGIHIQKPGVIFIEALNPAQDIRLTRRTSSKLAPTKQTLPCSNEPTKERMLVLLDSDATIYTKSGTIIFELGTSPISAGGESQTTMEEDEAHVLVQQSYPQESQRRSESDIVQSTPAIPETITEEPRVHETPSVKSRFMNPDSATVTLSRGKLSRADTFGDTIHEKEDSTPTGKKSTATMSPRKADMKTSGDFARSGEEADEEKESQNSAEAVRKQFSQSAMITSFGSAMDEVVSSIVDEDEDEGVLSDESTTPKSRIRGHGVPEGFLHEEHKREMTPKIVYGKHKRKAPVARNKNVAAKGGRKPKNTVEVINDSTEETTKDTQIKKRRLGRARKNSNTESMEEEDAIKVLPQMKQADRTEDEDAIMETADEEDEAAPQPPRTQRGRKTVQSLPSTAATVEADAVATGRKTRGKRAFPTKNTGKATKEQEKEPGIKEIVPPKPLRVSARGRRRVEDAPVAPDPISTTASEEPPEVAPNPKKPIRKRQRPDDTEGNDDQGTQSLLRESSAESMIQVGQLTKSKRVKTAPVEKTPVARRGKKDATPTPPSSGKFLGDTQYTVQDTQSQAPEPKTKAAAKKRAAPPAKKTPTRRQKPSSQSQLSEKDGIENEEDAKVSSVVTRTRSRYGGDTPKIVFSNSGLDGKKDIEKFLRANGGKKMANVSAAGVNFLVVGPGELKRTPKLTVGVALGKFVVEDQWLIDSKEIGYFLDPEPYIPSDPLHEQAWSFSLAAAIDRGRNGLNCVLKDYNIYITSSLISQLKASKQEDSLVEMLKAAGAGTIAKKSPKGKREDDEHAGQTLILGSEKGDGDIALLTKAGWDVYGTGIIAISVLRGKLDLGHEFKIAAPEVEATQKAGRGRKGIK